MVVNSQDEPSCKNDVFGKKHLAELDAAVFPQLPSSGYIPTPTARTQHTIPLANQQTETVVSSQIQLAWGLLIAHYTSNWGVMFGVTLSGCDSIIIPMRLLLQPEKRVSDALEEIQAQSLGMQKLEALPDESAIDVGCQIQSILYIQPKKEEEEEETEKSKTDLQAISLVLRAKVCYISGHIEIQARYDPQVMPKTQLDRILRQVEYIYQQIDIHRQQKARGNLTLNQINPANNPSDLNQLHLWNNASQSITTPQQHRIDQCVHTLIESVALTNPNSPAVSAWDGQMTYHELDSHANQLAKHLTTRIGVGPEVIVPLYFNKSMWTTVAMLGVMKAGGAFVLLDSQHPVERLKEVCRLIGRSSGMKLVVCSERNQTRAKDLLSDGGEVVVLSKKRINSWSEDESSGGEVIVGINPDNAVYAVFTSGSTGTPKGLVMTHTAVCSAAAAYSTSLHLGPHSRVMQFAAYAWDVSIYDILLPLMVGGCICIPSDQDRMSNLSQAINEFNANWITLTPSVARILDPARLSCLGVLILVGEPLRDSDIRQWSSSNIMFIPGYGATEVSLRVAIRSNCRPHGHTGNAVDARIIGSSAPAGGAVCCWIVDPRDHNRLSPIGAIGELVIEGPTIARGYLNDPETTARVFIDHPPAWLREFRGSQAGRLYKMGDLVQHTSDGDGSIRYIGRKDTQVKIRGQRLELEEVAYHVGECFPRPVKHEVAELLTTNDVAVLAVFIVREENRPEGKEETVPLIGQSDTLFKQDAATALSKLSTILPPYMVPTLFIPLNFIPITASGKLNRRLLKAEASLLSLEQLNTFKINSGQEANVTKRAPKTAIEEKLQRLAATVLNLSPDQIGMDDHFFRLGGDSLSAMKLVALAQEEGYSFTVGDVFMWPRVMDLSRKMDENEEEKPTPPFFLIDDPDEIISAFLSQTEEKSLDRDRIEDIYPATPMQDGLMALSLKAPGSYVHTFTYLLKPEIELVRFRAAFDSTVATNPITRTRLTQTEKGTFQVVIKEEVVAWKIYRSQEEHDRKDQMAAIGLNHRLLHVTLITSSPPRFLMTMHHAIYDGWSLPLLWEEIATTYYKGQPRSQQASPYNGFLRWIADGHMKRDSASFWRSQYASMNAVIFPSLPSDHYTPTTDNSLTYCIQVAPLPGLGSGLVSSSCYTMSTYIRLAWAIVLSHYTDCNDVLFGMVLSGRTAPVAGINTMTGPTLTAVPFRTIIKPESSIDAHLDAVQQQVTAMIPHEQMGLHHIRKLSTDAARACEFQSQLAIQPATDEMKSDQLFTAASSQADADYAGIVGHAFMLNCHLPSSSLSSSSRGLLKITARYDSNVVDTQQAQRIIAQFEHVLQQLLAQSGNNSNSNSTIRSISVVSPQDWRQLAQWNGTSLPPFVDHCVHDLILAHSVTHPEEIAISAWDGSWTYGQLDTYSCRLASQLKNKYGLQPNCIVPLCFERSKWAILAIVAVLRAGGTLLCLDHKYPTERLQFLLDMVKAKLVLCSEGPDMENKFAGMSAVTLVAAPFFNEEQEKEKGEEEVEDGDELKVVASSATSSSGSCEPIISPSSIAYITFTSGSTGQPKGIKVEHRNLSTAIQYTRNTLQVTKTTRALHFGSYSFDVTLYEILAPLAAGGCVCIPSESDRMNALAPFITRNRVNWLAMTPSVLAILDPETLPTVATVVTAGESLTVYLVDQWASRVHLVNAYGPAETTIYSAAGHVVSNEYEQWKIGTIGPMLGAVGWVIVPSDPSRLAPLGAVGELLIEGPIVSRGYLERPDLTAQGYIDPPEWLVAYRKSFSIPAGRLYRSGDLVVLTDTGKVRFIGRKDTQVKIRGQRIELTEAEYHVRTCFADFNCVEVVVDIVVVCGQDGTARRSPVLIAYVVQTPSEQGEKRTEKEGCVLPPTDAFQDAINSARNKLHDVVPAYMIPSIFIPLAWIPHTTNGKTDRKYLRTIVSSLSYEEIQQYHYCSSPRLNRQPSTAFETLIHEVWARVLNKDPPSLGVDDNFFHLGGDSITAMHVVSQLSQVKVGVTVDAIFREPTVARLASVSATLDSGSHNAIKQEKDMTDLAFNLSGIQNLLLTQLRTHDPSTETEYNKSSQAILLNLTRQTAPHKVLHAISSIVQKHPMLRARFSRRKIGAPEDGEEEWSQTISGDVNSSFKYREHTSLVSMEEAQTIITESHSGLNIHQGPLLVIDLMNIQASTASESRWCLSLIAHKLIIDDISFKIVSNDLEKLLSSSTNNGTSEQNTLQSSSVMQYSTWCTKQQKYSPDNLSHVNSPKSLAGKDDCISSQHWSHGGTEASYDSITKTVIIPQEETTLLLRPHSNATAGGSSNTAFATEAHELIHAALIYSFLHVFPDRTSPTVFKVEDGRKILWEPHVHTDLSDIVGCFTNLCPYKVEVDFKNTCGQDRLIEVVRKTKDSCREVTDAARVYLAGAIASDSLGGEKLEIVLNCKGLESTQQEDAEKSDPLFEVFSLPEVQLVNAGSRAPRFGLINIKADLIPESLRLAVDFTYPASMNHQISLLQWVENFENTLFEVAAVLPKMSPRRSRSDFPRLDLTDTQFERFCAKTDLLHNCVDAYPCSPIQHGMLLSRSRGHNNRYKNRHRWTIQPRDSSVSIDCALLAQAWEQLVVRHPLLRTVFVTSARGDGTMDQIVLPIDILQEQQEVLYSFTLSEINIGTDVFVACLLEIDHALIDGISLHMLLRDLALAYDGLLDVKPDFVFQEYVSYIQDQPVEPASEYWENYIEGMAPCLFPQLALVTDVVDHDEVGATSFTLNETDSSALRNFCIANEITQSTIFRLAWALVLRIYARTDDVCFGYLTSGRDAPIQGIQDAVGPFLNMLLCRTVFSDAVSTATMLKRCQMDFAQSLQFQYLSLAEIAHHYNHPRGQNKVYTGNTNGQGALFNSIITIHKVDGVSSSSTSSVPGVIIQQQVGDSITEYDLVLDISLSDNSTKVTLDYRLSHLTTKQSGFVLDAFQQAIHSIIQSDSQDLIIKLPLLGGKSMELVQYWNREELMPAVTERCVGDMIVERCGKQPTAPAICAWDGSGFTYAQLDAESRCLVSRIQKTFPGVVGPEVFVPICSEKSPWVIVAMVAVIRAGGAFILLDPSHPLDRLRVICEASQAVLVLASKDNQVDAAHLASNVLVIDDDDQPPISRGPNLRRTQRSDNEEQGRVQVSPKNALYAVFTSGSTGRPKGVVIAHQAFATSALAHGAALRLCPQSRVLQNTAYAFDVSLCELLTALLYGACVCIPSEEQRQQGRLDEAAADMQVNWAFFTPSLARVLSPADFPSVRTLVLGGELAGPKEIEIWSSTSSSPSGVDVLIGYGPTECSIFCAGTLQPLKGPTADGRNIGRCLGSRGWIVDPTNHRILLPVGAVGELVIDGPILAREYLNAPETTQDSFLEASFLESCASKLGSCSISPSARMYKTGDLVRYNTDGSLHFLGRKDLQVKLRGQRFELAEVEYQLRKALPNAIDIIAEVVSRPGNQTSKVLAAFIFDGADYSDINCAMHKGNLFLPSTPSFYESIRVAEARLRTIIPQYMVPNMFFSLRHIPMTVSGKTDRKQVHSALSGLSRDELQTYQGHSLVDLGRSEISKPQPSSPFEEALHAIWARVLNRPAESIGVNDEFFRVGGDSISSMQVVAQCSQAGLSLMMVDIFQRKTIQQLALVVKRQEDNSQAVARLVEQEEQDRSNGHMAIELSPIQQLFFQLAPEGNDHFNQSFFMKLKQRSVTVESLRLGISTLVRTHPMLRARFLKDQLHGKWTQTISPEPEDSFTLQEHYITSMEDAGPILDASQTGLDIGKGPIMAVNFLHLADHEEAYLFMVAHHLVIDLVSWRVLLADLEAFIKNEETTTGTPSISFLTWCALQQKYICSSDSSSCERNAADESMVEPGFTIVDYWGLNDGNEPFNNVWATTVSESISIDATATQLLFSDANDALQTAPVDLFHAALLFSFVRTFDDRPAPVIFNEGHGREPWDPQIDISRTIGWFTTFWPALVPVSLKNNLVDVLRRVKDKRRLMAWNGWEYFTSRLLQHGNAETRNVKCITDDIEILFNYMGRYQQFERNDSILQPIPLPSSCKLRDLAPDFRRFSIFDISASVDHDGCLRFNLEYPATVDTARPRRMKEWMKCLHGTLNTLAQQLPLEPLQHTLVDFRLLPLGYAELDELTSGTLHRLGIPSTEIQDLYPCAPIQTGILMSQAINRSLYQNQFIWKLSSATSGRVDVERVIHACHQVVRRHAILRTIFVRGVSGCGSIDQLVLKPASATITATGLMDGVVNMIEQSDRDEDEASLLLRLSKHRRAIGEEDEDKLPYQLLVAPHVLSGDVFVIMDCSHALVDGTSHQIIRRDLQGEYDMSSSTTGTTSIPAAPMGLNAQYRDYIDYLHNTKHQLDSNRTYWATYLKDAEPCFLPTSTVTAFGSTRQAPAQEQNNGSLQKHKLPLIPVASLSSFCNSRGWTPSNLFQVAWGIVLMTYTSNHDVCFGYFSSGRDIPVPNIQSMVGPLINALVCRLNLSTVVAQKDITGVLVEDILRDNQASALLNLQHQHVSLSYIMKMASTGAGTGTQRAELGMLFNTAMSVQRATSWDRDESHSSIHVRLVDATDPSEYDVMVNIWVDEHAIEIDLAYWFASISDIRAAQIGHTFYQTITGIITQTADLRIHELQLPVVEKSYQRNQYQQVATSSQHGVKQPSSIVGMGISPTTFQRLQEIWGRLLNIDPKSIGLHDNFFRLGGDSISAMQMASRISAAGFLVTTTRKKVTMGEIFRLKSMAALSGILSLSNEHVYSGKERGGSKEKQAETQIHLGADTAHILSPIQQLFFEQVREGHNHFNQSFFLEVNTYATPAILLDAIRQLVAYHPMLRMKFRRLSTNKWEQVLMNETDPNAFRLQHTRMTAIDDTSAVIATSQRALDIQHGPVFSVDLIDIEDPDPQQKQRFQQRLFLVAHHLVIDLVSWRIIFDDLEDYLLRGSISAKPTLPFTTWCRLQQNHAEISLAPEQAFPYEISPPLLEYWGLENRGRGNVFGDTVDQQFTLDEEITRALCGPANDAYGTQPVELFQAALLESFQSTFSDRRAPTIFSEGHGREPWEDSGIDLSHTVGWFTTMWPTYIPAESFTQKQHDHDRINEAIRRTKDHRRALVQNGLGYFASRYFHTDGQTNFQHSDPVEILFNFTGSFQGLERSDSLFHHLDKGSGWDVSEVGRDIERFAIVDVLASVVDKRLRFSVSYNRFAGENRPIDQWVQRFEKSLRMMAMQLPSKTTELTLTELRLCTSRSSSSSSSSPGWTYSDLDAFIHETCPQMGISPATIEGVYPCAPIQSRMLACQSHTNGLYHVRHFLEVIPDALISTTHVDDQAARLATAWCEVVQKHPILRSCIWPRSQDDRNTRSTIDSFYNQIVLRSVLEDITTILAPCSDPLRALKNLPLANLSVTAAGLGRPIHHLTICGLQGQGKVFCLLEINHAFHDGTSFHILLRDFIQAYNNCLPSGPGPSFQAYVDYLQSMDLGLAREYWSDYLRGCEPTFLDPGATRLPGNTCQSLRSSTEEMRTVDFDLCLAGHPHRHMCQELEFSLSSLVHVAWGLVLRKYTSHTNVCFGSMSSGRDIPLEGVINDAVGPYINTVVCRLDYSDPSESEISLISLLQNASRDYIQGIQHQHLGVTEVQRCVGTSENNHYRQDFPSLALFNTAISIQKQQTEAGNTFDCANSSSELPASSSISIEPICTDDPPEYDTMLNVWVAENGRIAINMVYWTTFMSDELAGMVAKTFQTAFSQLCLKVGRLGTVGDLEI